MGNGLNSDNADTRTFQSLNAHKRSRLFSTLSLSLIRVGSGSTSVAPFPRALIHIADSGLLCIKVANNMSFCALVETGQYGVILRRLITKMDPEHDQPTAFQNILEWCF
jgi:hypothetical protein